MEVYTIPDNDELKLHYQTLNKKLKEIENRTQKEIKQSLKKKLKTTFNANYLPDDLTTYLLTLKKEVNLPNSILPSSLFEKPILIGREKFFHRLASELIAFGLSYQRVYLKPIKLTELASLFHKNRTWWKCDIQDIEIAINILITNSIVQKTELGLLFEPLTMSIDIQTFLAFIIDSISDDGEIALSLIRKLVPWEDPKIKNLIAILSISKICTIDQNNNLIYFPEFKRG